MKNIMQKTKQNKKTLHKYFEKAKCFPTLSTFLPPGMAPLSQRTGSSPAGPAPPPGTWHPVPRRPAGRGHSCRRPTMTH